MGKGEGKGEGCCEWSPEVGEKCQVLEGSSGKWLPCEMKDITSAGYCKGKNYHVAYASSGGGLVEEVVPSAKIRQYKAAIALGPDGLPDLDKDRPCCCSDPFCALPFFIFIIGWIILATIAFDKGDPVRLLMPNDFRDEICGEFEPRTDYPEWFVPKPEFKLYYGICVKECPEPGAIVCNNDWENMEVFEAGRQKWDIVPPPAEWGRNNKEFEMNATEVAEVNDVFPMSRRLSVDLGEGATGTIARVMSQWPNVPFAILDPTGYYRRCNDCSARQKSLMERAVETEPLIVSFNCFSATYRTEELVHRCVPLSSDREQNASRVDTLQALAASTSAGRYFSTGYGELKACWLVLILSAFIALILSFIALVLIRWFLRPIVYTILLLILVVLICAGLACHIYANNLDEVTLPGDTTHENQVKTWRAFSYIFWMAAAIYFVVMLWLISRVRIAICVLEEASKALFSAPSVLIIPPLMFICVAGVFVWFLYLAAYIQTVHDISIEDFTNTTNELADSALPLEEFNLTKDDLLSSNSSAFNSKQTDEDKLIRYMHAYNFFGFLWMVQLVIAIAFFIVCSVVVMWFFSASTSELVNGEKEKTTVPLAMRKGAYRAFRYHFFTLVFGSLLIAIIQFVQAVLLYIEHQIPDEVKDSTEYKVISCCIHCFLAYLERIVKIINRNAYIFTAVFGNSFCTGAKRAFTFLFANIARVAVLTAMAEVVMFIIKICVCGSTVYFGMLMIREPSLTEDEDISSGLFPLFFILVISFIIATIVMDCYDTCVTTVFMCSLIDEDRAGEEGDAYIAYVPPSLAKLMDNFKDIGAIEQEYKDKVRLATAQHAQDEKNRRASVKAKKVAAKPPAQPVAPAESSGSEKKEEDGEGSA
eukprot:TRINITY_DN29853_c0_g1_i1.p1 TRINITY_DN29853_c0_g1~~TRINITY_DN29853_c0_g1_i1.p1  ORF type:complete len:875 (+),score=315.59 TRINITY_DN29853_c0_g1_i1:87-2711(+)